MHMERSSSFSLEGFITKHRNVYVSMQQCTKHVEYHLPNKNTLVGYLLKGFQCPDPALQMAMASIHTGDRLQGMCNNFDATAAHLLPYDPVIKKRAASTRHPAARILDWKDIVLRSLTQLARSQALANQVRTSATT